jgi:hypothetical protein
VGPHVKLMWQKRNSFVEVDRAPHVSPIKNSEENNNKLKKNHLLPLPSQSSMWAMSSPPLLPALPCTEDALLDPRRLTPCLPRAVSDATEQLKEGGGGRRRWSVRRQMSATREGK